MTQTASNTNELLCYNNPVKTHHDNRSDFLRKLGIISCIGLTTNSLMSLLDFICRRVGVGELTGYRCTWGLQYYHSINSRDRYFCFTNLIQQWQGLVQYVYIICASMYIWLFVFRSFRCFKLHLSNTALS